MGKATLQYLDKRDERGIMLRYSAHELSFDVSSKALDFIRSNDIYSVLVSKVLKKYIDLYYQKMIYESFLPIAHQLVIYRHDKQHYGKAPVNSINSGGFPCQALLREIWPDIAVDFSISCLNKIRNSINKQFYQLFFINNKLINTFYPFYNKSINIPKISTNGANIAVNYVEGFDFNKRSDLFWFNGSAVDHKSVVVYYESPSMMTRHDADQKAVEVIDEFGITQVKLWEIRDKEKPTIYDDKIKELISVQTNNNDIEYWMKYSAIHLCKRYNLWRSFFQDYEVKIHLDPIEYGLETIIKQLAIRSLGGTSIGKARSYPLDINGCILGFYPNDIFFSWDLKTAKRIKSTNQHIENVLVSGFPYDRRNVVPKNETSPIHNKHISNITRFNILLLDSNHGKNEGLSQFIETSRMVAFYRAFLDWVVEDEDIGVIIKPKKAHFLESLPGVINYIDEVEKNTDRCILIKNSFQEMPNTYLQGIDMVVGTGTFFSSAVVECVIHGARGVFYDYPNLRDHEKKLYEWGKNKVIFPDFDSMISALKLYKNDPSKDPNLGDWSGHLDDLDPFRDMKGGERIGKYIRTLQEAFDEGLERQDAIESANAFYADAWGDDKIYYSGGV